MFDQEMARENSGDLIYVQNVFFITLKSDGEKI